jgi:hypothetical protein
MDEPVALRDELLRLETALVARDPSGVDGALAGLIADDFLEFGVSGRTWDAETTRRALAATAGPRTVIVEAFEAVLLAPDVALTTFRTGGDRPANRSSIWVRRDDRWVVRFHQGTPRSD